MASSSEEGLRRVEGKVRERIGVGPFGSGFASAFRGRKAEANGLIDDAYENVWLCFRDMFKARSDLGAQVCVYVKGRKVVDLSGHSVHSTTKSYDSNSLQCIYSSGKNLEAYCIARLVEQGLVEYTDTIASHWPEFGQHGKDKLTVADVFRHEGGLIGFTHPDHYDDPKHDFTLNVEDLQERSRIASKIESSGLWYGAGNKGVKKRVYHAHTRGFIISELVHRIDPQKRYIDQFFDEEFAKPLDLSIYCALSPEAQKLHHYAAMKQPSLAYTVCFMVIPAMIGLGDKDIKSMIKLVTNKTNPLNRTAWKGSGSPVTPKYNNTVVGRSLEFTSAGVHANASSLAKLHAALASGGKVDGKQVLQPSTIERMLSDVTVAHDLCFGRETGFSQGGLGELSFVAPEFKNFYGWIGWGGSVFIFDPVREISFAFTLNGMGLKLTGDKRSSSLLAEVLKTYNATNDISLS